MLIKHYWRIAPSALPTGALQFDQTAITGPSELIAWLKPASGLVLGRWSESEQIGVERLGEGPADVRKRRVAYLSALAQVVNDARQEARDTYSTSRAWNAAPTHQPQRPDHLPVELFLRGGGARVQSIAEHVRSLARETRERCGLDLQVTPLPLPKELVGDLAADQYDRISCLWA